jgi:hypothetical protein
MNDRVDVVVIGGGSAGLAAAVTAAREGATVRLLERHGFLGGMGTASLVHTFCGLYLLRKEPDAMLANPGFPSEIAGRMIATTGQGPVRMGRVDVLPQHPVEFVRIADELVAGERSLDVRWHTEVTGASCDADGWEIAWSCRGQAGKTRASAVVDASGDAVLADWIGGSTEMTESPKLQRPAYVFGIQSVEAPGDPLTLAGWLVEGVRAGDLPPAALGLTFRASGRPSESFGTLDLTGAEQQGGYNPLDPVCLSRLEVEGRKVASAVVDFLRSRANGWQRAFISHWPARAGVRESRRWVGESQLIGADILAGRRFEDEIALATWPLELRETAKGAKLRFPDGDRPAGIPLGTLRVKGEDRLFVAGRCLSCDHEAQASIRVMGTCFATGKAAGLAAAIRAKGGEMREVAERLRPVF